MGVDGKSGLDDFRKMRSAVVVRGEFNVSADALSFSGVVLDAHVRQGDLYPHDLKPMPFGDGALTCGGSAIRTEFRQIVVDPLFQLVIEHDARIPSARAFNCVRDSLVQPVEVGVMVSFAWFYKTKVEGLILSGQPLFGNKPVASLGECEQLSQAPFLVRNGLHLDQALPDQVFDVWPHSDFVTAIGEFGQVFRGYHAEFAELDHRCDFGGPQTIAATPDFVDLAQFRRTSRDRTRL